MGTEQEKPLHTILQYAEATNLVGTNDFLDGTIAYRLGRLNDFCKAPARSYRKAAEKMRKETYEAQRELEKKMKGATDDDKRTISLDIQKLSDEMNEKTSELLDQTEKIKIPEFKLSDFIAKEDRKVKQEMVEPDGSKKIGEVNIKSGQTLVPTKFFSLMGDAIIDDKEALKFPTHA